jgi:acetoin:2,6-dichlorophenolindophenol oxidoreductase subunit beta
LESEVPEESYTIPLGEANIVREGDDLTIVAIARMVHVAQQAAEELAKEGIHAEVIDPRTTSPLDEDTILESVAKTGRLVVVDESHPRCNVAADIAALVAQKAFRDLKSPVTTVSGPHVPVPFSDALEDLYIPTPAKVKDAAREVLKYAK